ncbi:peptide ligase PGM1-related protein [Phormidium yuhuli AB48]|uniref:Peptide ligase PGM1-related protein n=1 Tax=Phormidium yuhuli AB48 TaxID=2940671 RepID=A0ABY5ASM8_9CYAN|nr:peptide ligase PGM1-related protein [Phormidium yuhuli]USR92218.1 peptide ligase PGM1-related protein [Phormidium yuhuli AB48]
MFSASIPESELRERFKSLQKELRDRWQTIDQFDQDDNDILVIPSITLDQRELRKIAGVHHYEERNLYSLIRLRNPRTRLVYVTSQPLHPSTIDYYLQLLPGIPFSHARDRLLLFSTYDSSPQPLTRKILDRPRLIERIWRALRPQQSYMVCFNATPLERELSVRLGIPLLALDPDLLYWGTKAGSRQIFSDCGIPHPPGSELVHSVDDLTAAASQLCDRQPQAQRFVVKLNEGFSGEGNALLDVTGLPDIPPQQRLGPLRDRFSQMRFQADGEQWPSFASRIPELGAIVELYIEGEEKRSPSVQCRITPEGRVEVLSTHDQLLGGPDSQVYLGCVFPADTDYRVRLQELGLRVGAALAEKGCLERFGVDFIAVHQDGDWQLHAIEINLRKGGTTHPFMELKLLTKGRYDLDSGLFYSQQGRAKFYRASDNLQNSGYHGLLPNDLMEIIAYHQLHFDSSTETGTIFHLMGCLSQFGKLGLTSIGNSRQEADEIYQNVVNILDAEGRRYSKGNREVEMPPSHPIAWRGRMEAENSKFREDREN